jgi:hypothetical protein
VLLASGVVGVLLAVSLLLSDVQGPVDRQRRASPRRG